MCNNDNKFCTDRSMSCAVKTCLYVKTRHVFVKHGCPRRQQSHTMPKISKSYILTPPHPQGHVMSVKCEQPLDELTVQVWLLYDHPNFKYCTSFISETELRTDIQTKGWTDRQTDGRTDDPNTRCPWWTFQAGGIKTKCVCWTLMPWHQQSQYSTYWFWNMLHSHLINAF